MRIIFVNLHSCWMLLKVSDVFIFKNSPAIKHGYLLKYLLEHSNEYEVCNYINDRGFSLVKWKSFFAKILGIIEHKVILYKNGIEKKKINIIKDLNDLNSNDIIILYNFYGDSHFQDMDKCNAFKALSMLHFHGFKSDNLRIDIAKIDCYINEVNLEKTSQLYRHFYHVKKPWVVMPFVFAERFMNKKQFKNRKNKAFSVGTITYKEHPDYFEVYKDSCLQPMRKFIKENPEFFNTTIDCFSEDYLEGFDGKKIKNTDNKIKIIYKKIYNRINTGKQKKYFSFDMVEKFNDYKMCIVGEEIIGIPGIGFVEGMACGCAYIGIDSPMYRDYGLIPGIHYIAYDGTKEGLRKTIEFYQEPKHQDELERIAKTGCEFVHKNFEGDTVAEYLVKELIRLRDLKFANSI